MNFVEKAKYKYGTGFAKQCIKSFMKKNKIDTIEELTKKYKTWDEIRQACKYQEPNYANIIANHGITMTDELLKKIIEQLKQEEEQKKKLQTNIKTTYVNGKEIATIKDIKTGETKTFDNSYTDKSIESQMKNVQKEHKQFQTMSDNNSLGIMNYMEKNIKISPDTVKSNQIKNDQLDEDEQAITRAVKIFEMDIGHPVKVDLSGKIIYDDDNIYTIEKRDGIYQIIGQEYNENKKNKNKGPQLVMKKNITNKAA